MWTLYHVVILPAATHSLENVIGDQQGDNTILHIEVKELSLANHALKDSINTLRSFGQFLGTHHIAGHTQFPLVGRMIRASFDRMAAGYVRFDLRIDTCGVYDDFRRNDCVSFDYQLPVAVGGYGPLIMGQERYIISCLEATDTSAVVEVYRAIIH